MNIFSGMYNWNVCDMYHLFIYDLWIIRLSQKTCDMIFYETFAILLLRV